MMQSVSQCKNIENWFTFNLSFDKKSLWLFFMTHCLKDCLVPQSKPGRAVAGILAPVGELMYFIVRCHNAVHYAQNCLLKLEMFPVWGHKPWLLPFDIKQ